MYLITVRSDGHADYRQGPGDSHHRHTGASLRIRRSEGVLVQGYEEDYDGYMQRAMKRVETELSNGLCRGLRRELSNGLRRGLRRELCKGLCRE